jgi:hypothetical protein
LADAKIRGENGDGYGSHRQECLCYLAEVTELQFRWDRRKPFALSLSLTYRGRTSHDVETHSTRR